MEVGLRDGGEDGLRLVSVVVDGTAPVNLITIALRTIVVSVKMIGIIFMYQSITTRTTSIVILIAVVTKRCVLVPVTIVRPDN